MKQSIFMIIGTRPEAIKLIPVYLALKQHNLPVTLCITQQHTSLLTQVLDLFGVLPDLQLELTSEQRTLTDLTNLILTNLQAIFKNLKPACVIVQGDTTSAMAGSLAAFYHQIPVVHIEAGLRSGNLLAPYPEEFNRKFISVIADYHFAPTNLARHNLLKEAIPAHKIFVTGNTVVDALKYVQQKVSLGELVVNLELQNLILMQKKLGHKLILLTVHRREIWGQKLRDILASIKQIALIYPQVSFVYPVHPNPIIKKIVTELDLAQVPNLHLLAPLAYHELVYLLGASDYIVTDSGGIQEESAALGKPVLVLRDETDRPETIQAGLAYLAGTAPNLIMSALHDMLTGKILTNLDPIQLYGSGQSANQIVDILSINLFKHLLNYNLKHEGALIEDLSARTRVHWPAN